MARQLGSRRSFGMVESLEPRRLLSDVIAVGPEFRVNTYTTDVQRSPSIAIDSEGDFVIAWSSLGQDGSDYGVYAQRYDPMGVPLGEEFRVNTYTTNAQSRPSAAMDADGHFVVAWNGAGQGDTGGVFAQRYNSAGVPQDTEFRVNSYTTNGQSRPSVAMDADGDFVIAWTSRYQDGYLDGVYAQRYNAAGVPQGAEFRVNTLTTGIEFLPSIAADADGDFVVAWSRDLGSVGIYAQRYNAAGVPQGGEFRVNTFTTGSFFFDPSVAMHADGDFVVAWRGPGQGDNYGVYAQRYDAAGVPQGGEFRVNSYTTSSQGFPKVAIEADDDFVVAWRSRDQDGSSYGVYAQRYNAAGVQEGDEFRVNTYTTDRQSVPAIAMDADGDFVVSWGSVGQDGSGYGVYAQRYAVVPEVTDSAFQFATAPHNLSFTFDRDVSASLATNDLVVQNLTTMQTITSSDFSISYDTATNVATFTYTGTTAGIVGMLPDGNYTATLIASGISTIQGAPLAADHVLPFRFLQADADNDGQVNLNDFNIVASNFGQTGANFSQGDFNYDTFVNLQDFTLLASRFGMVFPDPSSREPVVIGGTRSDVISLRGSIKDGKTALPARFSSRVIDELDELLNSESR